jgi:DnaJ family protein C protein 8
MSQTPSDSGKEASPAPVSEKDVPPPGGLETENNDIEDWQIQRDEHKKSADQAFRVGGFKTAIDQYTKAISLDPEFVVLYSNRSAAFLANGETSKALRDARKCVEVNASFLKGHSRLAAALLALKRFEQAKDSYEYVLKQDPKNATALKGVEQCTKEITKRMTLEEQKRQREEQQRKEAMEAAAAATTAAAEEEDGSDEDDLLNDFFDEVEEVVAKKKEAATTSTNAIRNDRETLGTTQEQIERLLQPRYEWRNLNPYFVLQLTAATSTDDDISRRYKALSLLLHPDKNRSKLSTEAERDRAQLAYDQVQKAKIILADDDRKRYIKSLVEEGMKQGESRWKREQHQNQKGNNDGDSANTLELLQEREVLRIFAQVEMKRREVEERERKFEQRERQQEDDQIEKERRERKFDKQWRDKDRVDKRVGNWRDFDTQKKRKL